MREVVFEKALRYKRADIIIQCPMLKEFVKKHRGDGGSVAIRKHPDFTKLENIADEVPMPMEKANTILHNVIDDITYIDMMSNARFFVMEEL